MIWIENSSSFFRTPRIRWPSRVTSGMAIVTIGIKPTEPATGYGYIHVGEPLPPPHGLKPYKTTFFRAGRFVEKPNLEKAVEYFEQALKIDPQNAQCWVEISSAQGARAGHGFLSYAEGFEQASAAAETALRLDPNLGGGYAMLARIFFVGASHAYIEKSAL